MELQEKIIKKYNLLLSETLKFYNREDCMAYYPSGLGTILNYRLGYRANSRYSSFINFLSKRYPYLQPFEEFSYLLDNSELHLNKEIFREINRVIKIIRQKN